MLQDSTKKFIIFLSKLGLVLILMFIHVVQWNEYTFSIIPLKLKSLVGMNSLDNLQELAKICSARMKYKCAESASDELAQRSGLVIDYVSLGDLRRKMSDYRPAISAYEQALAKSQANETIRADIFYGLAKAHEALQEPALALQNYAEAVKAKPNLIQVTVLKSYVQYLQSLGRAEDAKQVIVEARKVSNSENLLAELIN